MPEHDRIVMDTQVISTTFQDWISSALEILRAGGLVALPTDTVYGVGALAFDDQAVERIYEAKNRPNEKAIPILLGDAEDLLKVTSSVPEMGLVLAGCFWPGPLTLVLPKHPALPDGISNLPTVGVRVPDHAVARALLQAAGPMAVTSANLSGLPSTTYAGEVLAQLGGRIPLILDGGRTRGGIPSTVVDCTGADPKILRQGPISREEIIKALGLEV
jgi:L-threonylcarbamoyladenylate synthase